MGGKKYDVVLLIDVLEHLEKPYFGLRKIHNALRVGGILFLNVPVCDSLQKRLRRLLLAETRTKQMKDWDETHIKGYSKKELIKMLKKTGFEIQESRRLSNLFPFVWFFSGRLSCFLQQFTFFGFFGDFFTIAAKKGKK